MIDRPGLFPFNDILALLDELPPVPAVRACNSQATDGVAAPCADGALAARARWLAGWQGRATPRLRRPVVAVFAASHAGPALEATGDLPAEIDELVAASQSRTALVCRVCDRYGLGLRVFELAPEIPVGDFTSQAAMEEADCAATVAYGMEATAGGADLLVVRGEASGHAASVAAMAAALLGQKDAGPLTSIAIEAIRLHEAHTGAPLEILRRIGGREAAALAGAILAARLQQVPVVLDGSGAACIALLLDKLKPGAAAHCVIAADDGHPDFARLQAALGLPVMLTGVYPERDGTAGALAAGLLQAAVDLAQPEEPEV